MARLYDTVGLGNFIMRIKRNNLWGKTEKMDLFLN